MKSRNPNPKRVLSIDPTSRGFGFVVFESPTTLVDWGCRYVPVSLVKKVFGTFRANTKHEIAHAVAQQLPELAPELPRYRKAWMSEGSQMAIFDAAALALTY